MRIAHVVTLVGRDGAYGGPLSVAQGHCIELARRGHDVTLIAGWDGYGSLDTQGSRVRVSLCRVIRVVPMTGFSGLYARHMRRALTNGPPFDVVHLHLARDLITLGAGRVVQRMGLPYVAQTHGMVMPDRRWRVRLTDAIATQRVLSGASTLFALTDVEAAGLGELHHAQKVHRIRNGISPLLLSNRIDSGEPPEVLFCARLHPRKRVTAFVDMAAELVRRGVEAQFSVVGPDEGDLVHLRRRVQNHGLEERLRYDGPLAPALVSGRLRVASVFVLPSISESFPMTVLESLAAGTPVVLTDGCGIAEELAGHNAAIVTNGSVIALADAVQRILADPVVRLGLARRGQDAISALYSIENTADELEAAYDSALQ